MARKQSKIEGRASKKLDEVLHLCSTLNAELQSVRKQLRKQSQKSKKQSHRLKKLSQKLKKQRQQNRYSAKLTEEMHGLMTKDKESLVINKAPLPVQSRRLELSFVCALPRKMFTGTIIYAIDGGSGTLTNVPVRLVLLDEDRKVVNSADPLSSLEIEIVVACGHLKTEEESEFETSLLRPRNEKGALLVGSCLGKLQNGECSFNDLKFMDNSSREQSKTFKLVAKVVESAIVPKHVQVRPAVSGAVRVIDQRGKPYEKHSVPSWDSEVWRLNKIRKNGPYHKKLEAQGIRTVMDFRQRFSIDQSSLRKILGAKGGLWATIVQHANECCPNSERFRYDSEEGVELLFDCFYHLISVSFDHQNNRSLETLNELEKNHVEQLRRRALEDHSKLIHVSPLSTWPSANASPWITPDLNPQQPPPHQESGTLKESVFECEHFPQPPLRFSAEDMHQLEEPTTQRIASPWIPPDPNPQQPPLHQDSGESTLNASVFECEHFPQSPLWPSAEDVHQVEEPARIADIEGFGAVESGCILWDSLNLTEQHHPYRHNPFHDSTCT